MVRALPRPVECLTMLDIGMLQRMAARYAETVREHAYLVGLMNLAVRTGDADLLATAKKRLAETERECKECSMTLEDFRRELLCAEAKGDGDLVAAGETHEYAMA